MGILNRLGATVGSDVGKAFETGHQHFQERLNVHGHFGRALIESIAEVCRDHPNLVGIAVGVLVEQFLVHEKHVHESEVALNGGAPHAEAPSAPRAPPHAPHHELRLWRLRPGRMALEVFGALVLLKFGAGLSRAFTHRRASLSSVARIHLFSATIATYLTVKALKSHEVSAWRNAAILLFATDALKPLLTPDYSRPPPAPRPAPAAIPSEMHERPPTPPPIQDQPLTFH